MSSQQFPIVKIDRTTGQEMLPLLMQKGIFSDFQNLPFRDEILKEECDKLEPDNYGCRQPFKINIEEMKATVCDYI